MQKRDQTEQEKRKPGMVKQPTSRPPVVNVIGNLKREHVAIKK